MLITSVTLIRKSVDELTANVCVYDAYHFIFLYITKNQSSKRYIITNSLAMIVYTTHYTMYSISVHLYSTDSSRHISAKILIVNAYFSLLFQIKIFAHVVQERTSEKCSFFHLLYIMFFFLFIYLFAYFLLFTLPRNII